MNTAHTAKTQAKHKTLIDPKRAAAIAGDVLLATRAGEGAIYSRQSRRLTGLISHARERSPLYRRLYSKLPTHHTPQLSALPPTEKAQLMEDFDGWVTDPEVSLGEVEEFLGDGSLIGQPYLGRYLVWTSSGTSGIPAAFLQDRRALAVMAVMSLLRGPFGLSNISRITLSRNRQAGVYGVRGHLHGAAMMEHMRAHPGQSEKFTGFSALTPLPELVHRLNHFQPAMFWCFSSILSLLAEEQLAGRLEIAPILILSGGEALSQSARQRMEEAFHCPVRDYYGTAEAAGLSYDCEYGWLHVNADWFILEAVDEDYHRVEPGETSHTTLLTNLANHVQPLIRYDLGDRISFKEGPCPCGSPLPAIEVEGRRNEVISFQKEDGREVNLPPRALTTVIDFTPGVYRCQAIKASPTGLKLRLEVEAGAEEGEVFREACRRVGEYLGEQGLSFIEVYRDSERPTIDSTTGKFRHVWSEVESQATTW